MSHQRQGTPLPAQPTRAAALLVAAPPVPTPNTLIRISRSRKIENREKKKKTERRKRVAKDSMALRGLNNASCLAAPSGRLELPASISPSSAQDQTIQGQRDAPGSGDSGSDTDSDSDSESDGDGAFTGYEARKNTVKKGASRDERPPCEEQRIQARVAGSTHQRSGGP